MISLFCPSRGRPEAARELRDSFNSTIVTDEVELVFLVDTDDLTRHQYLSGGDVQLRMPTGDPTGPLNAAVADSSSDIVGFIGDDSRFETVGWDDQVRSALRNPGFCWGFDGTSGQPWPSTAFVSRDLTLALGWMVPPTLRRGFFDVVWIELANATRTARVIDAMFRHDNSAGDPRSPNFRPSHQVPPAVIAADERAFGVWRRDQMPENVRSIRSLIYL